MLIPKDLGKAMIKEALAIEEARLLQASADFEAERGEFIGMCKYCEAPIYEGNLMSPCCAGMYPK